MIDVKCSQCKTGFQLDVPQEIWDADLATRSEWVFKQLPSLNHADLVVSYAATNPPPPTIDANTEELLLYRVCEKCWEEVERDY